MPKGDALRPAQESFAGRSYEAVALEARGLARGKKDVPGALRRWRAMLARNLPEEERLDALMGLGVSLRAQRELKQAEATFRRVIRDADPNGVTALSGHLQLGAVLFDRGDYQGTLAEVEHVTRSRHAVDVQVVNARGMGVTAMIKLKDVAGAKRELESMLADYADKEGWEPLLAQYRSQLERLE